MVPEDLPENYRDGIRGGGRWTAAKTADERTAAEAGGSPRVADPPGPPSVWEGRRVRPDQQKTARPEGVVRLTARRPAVGHYTSGSEKENLEPVGTLGS